jgi:hypothetical protein
VAGKDLTGQVFERLTVLRDVGRGKGGYVLWECQCSCGKLHIVKSSHLLRGNSRSCGCLRNEQNTELHLQDMAGKRFGRWMVLERGPNVGKHNGSKVTWLCRCDCGTEKLVAPRYLNDNSKSCGCLKRELAKAQLAENNKDRVYEKGSEHKWWNSTLETKLRDRQRPQTNETAIWRKQVYERDNYTCQICSQRGKSLAAHHITPWLSSVELRFDVANGVTLCVECHRAYHAQYFGAKGNSTNFAEFKHEYIHNLTQRHLEESLPEISLNVQAYFEQACSNSQIAAAYS